MNTPVATPAQRSAAPRSPSRAIRSVSVSAIAIAVVAVMGAAGMPTASAADRASEPLASSCTLAVEAPLSLDNPGQAPPAAALLRRLADRLRSVPADAQTGRYAYASIGMQAADSTLDGSPCVQTVTAYAAEQHWRADDGSGQVTGTPWHPDPTDPPPAQSAAYPAGELPGVVDGPVPANPKNLAAALDAAYPPVNAANSTGAQPFRAAANARQCRQHGTAARLRAVADLTAWHYTNRAARRAVLLVLADVSGLSYRGAVAGYPGAIAVSADSGDWRDVVVLDPTSGVLLAYEQVLLGNGQALGVRTPYSNARFTYLGHGRTAQAGRIPPHAGSG